MSNKVACDFDGFDVLLEAIETVNHDIRPMVTETMEHAHALVTHEAAAAIQRHRRSGDTERSLITEPSVKWEGTTADVDVGFRIRNGGLPSIFLMYGTPRMAKDTKLYAAFKGAKIQKKIKEEQRKVMEKYLTLAKGK